MATDRRVLYADASALVKLVVAEEETAALERFLAAADTMIVTSRKHERGDGETRQGRQEGC